MKEKIQTKTKTTKSTFIIILLILAIISAAIFSYYAYSKYTSTLTGNGTATVAKWSFKLVDGITETSYVIDFAVTRTDGYANVEEGLLAPGTFGEFEIGLDARGTETAVKYTIDATMENKPTNLKLYSDSEKTEEISVVNNQGTVEGYLTLEEVSEIQTVKIYWDWPYESGDDKTDTADAGKTMTMQISVTGTEVLELPARIISFTIDGTTYYAEEGMTWSEWGQSTYNTGDWDISTYVTSVIQNDDGVYYMNYVSVDTSFGGSVNEEDVINEYDYKIYSKRTGLM